MPSGMPAMRDPTGDFQEVLRRQTETIVQMDTSARRVPATHEMEMDSRKGRQMSLAGRSSASWYRWRFSDANWSLLQGCSAGEDEMLGEENRSRRGNDYDWKFSRTGGLEICRRMLLKRKQRARYFFGHKHQTDRAEVGADMSGCKKRDVNWLRN